jgi:hypothetical protein
MPWEPPGAADVVELKRLSDALSDAVGDPGNALRESETSLDSTGYLQGYAKVEQILGRINALLYKK